jgi:hypothetical protein
MTDKELIDWFTAESGSSRYVRIPEDVFNSMDEDQARMLASHFSHSMLMLLPQREISFFEWLREKDFQVWDDLWGGVEEEPYVVGLSFLPLLLDKTRGFPICDLLTTDNYYFADAHFASEESKMLLESVQERFLKKEALTVAQTLMLEISVGPIDIWHFAYKYGIQLDAAKKAVSDLVDEKILFHFRNAEQLAGFIEF